MYVQGHWFKTGKHQIKIYIEDDQGKKIAAPPPLPATAGVNGIFETKLVLENIPFKSGTYNVTAEVIGGPRASTELRMVH